LKKKACAFLTMENTDGWSIDTDLAVPCLEALGWRVDWIKWREQGISWDDYDAVYICTAWDYPEAPDRFMEVLGRIDASSATLVNDIETVRWNLSKTYLRNLQESGVDTVPSIWCDGLRAVDIKNAFNQFATGRIVVKPVVSTNAVDTFVLDRSAGDTRLDRFPAVFADRSCVIQPFIGNIQSEGEYSLFYFGNEFSHAILKRPKAGDFRVQEEYGAELSLVEADDRLRSCAEKALRLVRPEPVYARCDFVRDGADRYLLMELELIEPSMYLRMEKGSAERFARAFDRYVRH